MDEETKKNPISDGYGIMVSEILKFTMMLCSDDILLAEAITRQASDRFKQMLMINLVRNIETAQNDDGKQKASDL